MCRPNPTVGLLIAYLMIPGAHEVVENIVHLVSTGHGAHALHDAAHDFDGNDEHGCSGPFHLCRCHTSSAFQRSEVQIELRPLLVARPLDLPVALAMREDEHALGVFRPPIG